MTKNEIREDIIIILDEILDKLKNGDIDGAKRICEDNKIITQSHIIYNT